MSRAISLFYWQSVTVINCRCLCIELFICLSNAVLFVLELFTGLYVCARHSNKSVFWWSENWNIYFCQVDQFCILKNSGSFFVKIKNGKLKKKTRLGPWDDDLKQENKDFSRWLETRFFWSEVRKKAQERVYNTMK